MPYPSSKKELSEVLNNEYAKLIEQLIPVPQKHAREKTLEGITL
jgi:hypothetical protein